MKKRHILFLLGTAFFALLLVFSQFFGASVEAGSWGLHFSEAGSPPAGPESAAALEKLDAAYVGDAGEKVLYLTFDAGYENGCTAQILDALKKHNAPAAFFLVGNYIEKNPDLVRRMVAEGHIVGNHTLQHPDMRKLTDLTAFSQQLQGVEDLFREVTGKELPKYYRPPQGCYSEENLKMAQQLGYRTVFWSLAYVDWNSDAQPGREVALQKLLPRTHNGAVVLLHATSKTNAQVLDELLSRWEEMGYGFAPISALFQ